MKKGEWFPPSYFFPKFSVFIFFPQQPVFPLRDHKMSHLYTMINRSVHNINKKSRPPFSFSSFSFPLFPFPLFLLFHFVPHCLIFHFFSPGTISPPPPLAIVFCTIYTPDSQEYLVILLAFQLLINLAVHGFGCYGFSRINKHFS